MNDDTKQALDKALLDFNMVATYLPKDLTQIENEHGVFRVADLNKQMLEYNVSISYKGRHLITTPFSMGIGHIPGFSSPGRWTQALWDRMKWVFKEGRAPKNWLHEYSNSGRLSGEMILPTLPSVMHSLLLDSDALEHQSFEQWANDFGYDTDSRKAEESYKACLSTGLKLTGALGRTKMQELREAFQDY